MSESSGPSLTKYTEIPFSSNCFRYDERFDLNNVALLDSLMSVDIFKCVSRVLFK